MRMSSDKSILDKAWGWAKDKGKDALGWTGDKAKGLALDAVGYKDTDGDGERDFEFMSLAKNLGKGGIGLLAFGLMNKMLGMGFFKSALISIGVVLAMNYLPKLMDNFNAAAPGDSPKTPMANKKDIASDPNVISNKTTGVPTNLKLQPEPAFE